MKLIKNTGNDRVVDELRGSLATGAALDMATPVLSLHAFGELIPSLGNIESCRLVYPAALDLTSTLLGGETERLFRNRLRTRALALQFEQWLRAKAEARFAAKALPQSLIAVRAGDNQRVLTGHCPFTTDGLGLTPSGELSLIQCAETPEEIAVSILAEIIRVRSLRRKQTAPVETE